MKKAISLLLALVLCLSLTACGKSEAVKNVEAMIDALGEITLESIDAIRSAEDAYNALTADEQKKVENYKSLTAARDAYFELALVGDWAELYINLYDVEGMYNQLRMVLNADMTGTEYADGEEAFTWSVTDCILNVDYGGATRPLNIVEENNQISLEQDGWTLLTGDDYRAYLDDIFLIVDLSEVDVNEYCEPVLYNFQDVDTWGEPIDEVCTMLMLKNKLYEDGWLYLSQLDDLAIEIFTPEYNVSSKEETIASSEITVSEPFGAVYKLYYWYIEDGEPTCDLKMGDVAFGRTRGKIIFINSAYVKEVKQDEWRRVLINDFTESGDFFSGSWYEGFDY